MGIARFSFLLLSFGAVTQVLAMNQENPDDSDPVARNATRLPNANATASVVTVSSAPSSQGSRSGLDRRDSSPATATAFPITFTPVLSPSPLHPFPSSTDVMSLCVRDSSQPAGRLSVAPSPAASAPAVPPTMAYLRHGFLDGLRRFEERDFDTAAQIFVVNFQKGDRQAPFYLHWIDQNHPLVIAALSADQQGQVAEASRIVRALRLPSAEVEEANGKRLRELSGKLNLSDIERRELANLKDIELQALGVTNLHLSLQWLQLKQVSTPKAKEAFRASAEQSGKFYGLTLVARLRESQDVFLRAPLKEEKKSLPLLEEETSGRMGAEERDKLMGLALFKMAQAQRHDGEAARLFREAISRGNPDARYGLAVMIDEGRTDKDEEGNRFAQDDRFRVAAKVLRPGVQSYHVNCFVTFVDYLQRGEIHIDENGNPIDETNRQEVLCRLSWKAIELHQAASFNLGLSILNGSITKDNLGESIIDKDKVASGLFRIAIKENIPMASHELACLILEGRTDRDENGELVTERNRGKTLARLYYAAVKKGHALSHLNLAYLIGEGTIDKDENGNGNPIAAEKRYKAAFKHYTLAIKAGLAIAFFNLGSSIFLGRIDTDEEGIPILSDVERRRVAERLWIQSSLPEAFLNLGLVYAQDSKTYAQALDNFAKAVEAGVSQAIEHYLMLKEKMDMAAASLAPSVVPSPSVAASGAASPLPLPSAAPLPPSVAAAALPSRNADGVEGKRGSDEGVNFDLQQFVKVQENRAASWREQVERQRENRKRAFGMLLQQQTLSQEERESLFQMPDGRRTLIRVEWYKGILDQFKSLIPENARKVSELIDAIKVGDDSFGNPKCLKGDLKGKMSRRINHEHRLVYSLQGDVLTIYSCKGHYDD
jgi:toxin YoeB